MLESIDCMHWPRRNSPVAWKDQYTRCNQGCPTIKLEAVISYDLWIWHAYFGPTGSNNDINVLNELDMFVDLLHDRIPLVVYNVNEVQVNKGYYIADEIYLELATLVKSFKCPDWEKVVEIQEISRICTKGCWTSIWYASRSLRNP